MCDEVDTGEDDVRWSETKMTPRMVTTRSSSVPTGTEAVAGSLLAWKQ
jgi:hypothetical protein